MFAAASIGILVVMGLALARAFLAGMATFLAWAVVDRISMKRRVQRALPGAKASKLNDVIAVVAGLILYVWFVKQGHAWLIGVADRKSVV